MRNAFILTLLVCVVGAANAALLQVDQIVWFTSSIASCASFPGFEDIALENRGQLFLGGDGNVGYRTPHARFTAAQDRAHAHTGSTSVQSIVSTTLDASSNFPTYAPSLKTGTGTLSPTVLGTVSSGNSNFPFVTLRACRVTAQAVTLGLQIPTGAILFMDPKTTQVDSIKTCATGAGFENFPAADGRFIIASTTPQPAPSGFATPNPTPAFTASTLDFASHTHQLSAQFSLPNGRGCGNVGSTKWLKPGTYTASGPSSGSSPAVPYVVARHCKANTEVSDYSKELPVGAALFFARASCPSVNWLPSNSVFVGRLILSAFDASNTQFGGSTLLTPTTAGIAHGHTSFTGAKIIFSGNSRSSLNGGSACTAYDSAGYNVGTGTVAQSTVNIPTLTMLLCERVNPTAAPTQSPTTSKPTFSPTRAPTKQPTFLPTQSPSQGPTTSYPSWDPTPAPTKMPTTGRPSVSPSKAPTHSRPTRSPTTPTDPTPTYLPSVSPTESPSTSQPSAHPSTSIPTYSPTMQPVEQNMCTEADKAIFVEYDNFFNFQAASCAAECKNSLISKIQSNIEFCANKCKAFAEYSKLCTKCHANFLVCQANKCNTCFVSGQPFLAQACKTCAATNCRDELATCGGFPRTVLSIPTSAPVDVEAIERAERENEQLVIIIASSVGGVALFLALVLALRRASLNRRANKEVEDVANKIFKNRNGDFAAASGQLMPSTMNANQVEAMNPSYVGNTGPSETVEMRVPLRTRYSFHGEEYDELDVAAGVALLGLSKNDEWWIALDESTGKVGVLPASYVAEV